LLFTLIFGANLNDASRWIKLPIVNQTLQTSDVARLALFMYLARLLSRKQRHITDFKKGYLPLLGPVLLTCALIAPANLSTCLLTGATGLMVIFMGGASIRHIVGTIFIALVPVILLVGIAMATYKPAAPLTTEQQQDAYVGLKRTGRIGTWISRIQDFIYAKGDEVPHQLMQAKIAIAKGQWFGRGPGNSEQRNFLPHPYSDFIYAIIVEEYGFIGGVLLVLLYMLFLYRCIKLLQKFPYAFGTFLAMALSITLATQAIANMAVNVGLVPVTGVTLPLVSMGGTSMLFTCFAIGTILSVARNAELLEGKAQAQKAADNTAIEQEEDEEEQQREDIESAKQEGGAHA
ncbi:MAG TPA: FtsW/RodA/SpoVE family cell cycle protein, partial [Phnomibacter sp.]|nr:FtsW/RodA/SpoVE family cell cycle protein [Phnomibacter sp.]